MGTELQPMISQRLFCRHPTLWRVVFIARLRQHQRLETLSTNLVGRKGVSDFSVFCAVYFTPCFNFSGYLLATSHCKCCKGAKISQLRISVWWSSDWWYHSQIPVRFKHNPLVKFLIGIIVMARVRNLWRFCSFFGSSYHWSSVSETSCACRHDRSWHDYDSTSSKKSSKRASVTSRASVVSRADGSKWIPAAFSPVGSVTISPIIVPVVC